MLELLKILPVANQLGEGVIWDHRRQRLWWTDIEGCVIYRYDPITEHLEQWPTPERLACMAPIEGRRSLVVAFASGFAFYHPPTGAVQWIAQIEADNPGTRMNDGRIDRQGRFWAGSMTEQPKHATYKGSLYCLDHNLAVSQHLGGLAITNSLCWSPDGQRMYHCDTPRQSIQAYDFDLASGQESHPRTIVKTDKGCYPDGSCVDAEGGLWNAQWGGSRVVRYLPDGTQDIVLKVPTSQPSCVAFGGENLDLLFVTSAWQDMGDKQRSADPNAGNLLIYQTNFTGLADSEFKLAADAEALL